MLENKIWVLVLGTGGFYQSLEYILSFIHTACHSFDTRMIYWFWITRLIGSDIAISEDTYYIVLLFTCYELLHQVIAYWN